MVSSATYLLNDILDVESDRKHPTKCNRRRSQPVIVSVPLADRAWRSCCSSAGIGVALRRQLAARLVVADYAVLTTTYSLFLKTIPVIDLVILSAGFILRLLGGAYAAEVPVSDWFLIISLFGSLFIAAAKRFAEKKELGDRAAELRPTLGEYSLEYLGFLRGGLGRRLGLMSYCMWAVERAHVDPTPRPWVAALDHPVPHRDASVRPSGRPGQGLRPGRRHPERPSDADHGSPLGVFLFVGIYG